MSLIQCNILHDEYIYKGSLQCDLSGGAVGMGKICCLNLGCDRCLLKWMSTHNTSNCDKLNSTAL